MTQHIFPLLFHKATVIPAEAAEAGIADVLNSQHKSIPNKDIATDPPARGWRSGRHAVLPRCAEHSEGRKRTARAFPGRLCRP